MNRLAILHYHLNRGGVTRVIANQLTALDAALDGNASWQVLLVYGGRDQGWSGDLAARCPSLDLRLVELPALDYDKAGTVGETDLSAQLNDVLAQHGFAPPQTIIHVHNHSLGKNLALPGALIRLAEAGFGLLLQIHDFAEDFRPANYRRMLDAEASPSHGRLAEQLYPQAPRVHYAALNDRDLAILRGAGVDESRLHLLPNPVLPVEELPTKAVARAKLAERFGVSAERAYVLYPVRCIRRKNLGEMLLWSLLSAGEATFACTLPPLNPDERPTYERWKTLAKRLKLSSVFEVGSEGALSFAENLATADMLITTSLAEGFGMVFLETWLVGRPLIGRDLPEITPDFRQHGVRLDTLAPRFEIPVDWVGLETFREMIETSYRNVLAAYHRPVPESHWLSACLDEKIRDGKIDFGDLDVALQVRVIEQVAEDSSNRERLIELNPWAKEALGRRAADWRPLVTQNAEAVERNYSILPSGRRLLEVYQAVAATKETSLSRPPMANAAAILDAFLDIRRFQPLRIP